MRILVSGACGGIGSHLIPQLISQGHHVLAVDDLSSGNWSNLEEHKNLKKITMDITNKEMVANLGDKETFQYLFHLAAISSLPECQIDPARAFEVNFLGTINLVKLAKTQVDFKNFIFASTSAIYENNTALPFVESAPVDPSLVYPLSKLFSERYLESEGKLSAFPSIIVRIFNVFGDFQNFTRTSPPILNYIVREVSAGRTPILHGDGKQERDFISVDDVVEFLVTLLNSPIANADIVNLCRGQLISVNQIFSWVLSGLNSDILAAYTAPTDLWNSYPDMFNGVFPLNKEFVANEVGKISLGDPSKLKNKYGWTSSAEIAHQVADVARRMNSRLRDGNE
jgi:nucleoside-diphosphate-sugar epimerase